MNIVITGASRGIGRELCQQGLQRGFQVAAVARDGSRLPRHERLRPVHADVTDPESSAKILDAIADWKSVDVLINNAGVYRKGVAFEDFMVSFHVNAVAPLQIAMALMPKLTAAASAKVVHVTSLMGSIADNSSGGSYAYRASKAALNMINKSLAVDHPRVISVVIHPGWVQTDMGGANAPTPVAESAGGIWSVIDGLGKADTGRFLDFRGKELPW